MFNKEGSAGIDVKVPSTSNREKLIWEHPRTEEVQKCRQIAAISTVILMEKKLCNETSEGSGKLVAQNVTWIAYGDPWAWATANSRKYLVYCSMLKRSSSKAAVRFIPKYSSVDEARWKTWQNRSELLKKTARTWWKDWPRIRFSESSPVKLRKKVMKYHRWQVSNCIKRFIPKFNEKNLCTSELIKVTEARIWIFRRCLTKDRERIRTHHCCIMLDLQDMKIHENLKDLWQEDVEYAKAGKHSHSCRHRIRTPTWRTSPTSTWKNHHDRLFVVDLEAVQNALEFCQDSERECLVLRHSSVRVLHKDHQPQRLIRKARKRRK